MNNLLSGQFSIFNSSSSQRETEAEMATAPGGGGRPNLNKFFKDVDSVKEEMKEIEQLHKKLNDANEESKQLHSSKAVKQLRSKMDHDVVQVLKKAKMLKVRLEELDRANEANRSEPGCGPDSSEDRMRTVTVSGLRKKLKEKMEEFQELREKINKEYRDTVQRRYFTVTGENPDEKTVDLLISTGESETFLHKAIQQQGRGRILDTITEIQERHDAVVDIERNLRELHQVFLDMSVLVEQQGHQLDDIEANVQRANSYVEGATRQLHKARRFQKNTRKWTCYGIILLLIIILVIVLSIRPWK